MMVTRDAGTKRTVLYILMREPPNGISGKQTTLISQTWFTAFQLSICDTHCHFFMGTKYCLSTWCKNRRWGYLGTRTGNL